MRSAITVKRFPKSFVNTQVTQNSHIQIWTRSRRCIEVYLFLVRLINVTRDTSKKQARACTTNGSSRFLGFGWLLFLELCESDMLRIPVPVFISHGDFFGRNTKRPGYDDRSAFGLGIRSKGRFEMAIMFFFLFPENVRVHDNDADGRDRGARREHVRLPDKQPSH